MPRRRTALPQTDTDTTPEQQPVKKIRRKKTATTKKPKPTAAKKLRQQKTSVVSATPLEKTAAPQFNPPTPKRAMSTMACFVYGCVVCLMGTVALGLLLGFVLLPPLVATFEQSQYSYAAPATSEDPAVLKLPSAAETSGALPQEQTYGFYGTLLSKDSGVLMVKELIPPLALENKTQQQPESKTFIVRISDQTAYTYQRPQGELNPASPLFAPEEGGFDSLKKDMFVFVNTKDDPEKMENLNADHILYSELSPFAE